MVVGCTVVVIVAIWQVVSCKAVVDAPKIEWSDDRVVEDDAFVRVIDGDTLEVIWKGETNAVRFVGVEAPEIRRGQKLTAFAERFKMPEDKARKAGQDIRSYLEGVALGEEVVLEFPGERADSFGRWLAYVDCGGLDVGAELLDRGYAVTRSEAHPRSATYLEIAERAERENRGLWAWAAR